MNKLFLFLCTSVIMMACDRKPFVEHELKFEKVGDDCAQLKSYLRLNSNFGGERFEFEKCLPVDFAKDQLVSERRGDSVVIRFRNLSDQKKAVYHITLDIDSYPAYGHLTIDNDTYEIAPSPK